MPLCTICNHKEKEKLNVGLINGTPTRELEKVFGVSKSAVSRHKTACLPLIVAAALQTNVNEDGEDGPEPETVRGRAEEMCGKGRVAILQALKRKDYKTAFAGMREHRGYMETIGKVTGELNPAAGHAAQQPMFILPAGAMVNVTINQSSAQPRRGELPESHQPLIETTVATPEGAEQ